MADAKTSQRYEDAMALVEIGFPFEFVEALKGLAQKFEASTLFADLGTGGKVRAGGASGGKGRGRTYAARDERWKRMLDGIIAKHPAKDDSAYARILLKEIAKENPDAPEDQTGRIPEFDRMRRLVAEWRKPSD